MFVSAQSPQVLKCGSCVWRLMDSRGVTVVGLVVFHVTPSPTTEFFHASLLSLCLDLMVHGCFLQASP